MKFVRLLKGLDHNDNDRDAGDDQPMFVLTIKQNYLKLFNRVVFLIKR